MECSFVFAQVGALISEKLDVGCGSLAGGGERTSSGPRPQIGPVLVKLFAVCDGIRARFFSPTIRVFYLAYEIKIRGRFRTHVHGAMEGRCPTSYDN